MDPALETYVSNVSLVHLESSVYRNVPLSLLNLGLLDSWLLNLLLLLEIPLKLLKLPDQFWIHLWHFELIL